MRFFFGHTPFFAILPTLVVGDANCIDSDDEHGTGWHIGLLWAGFGAGVIFS